MILRDYQQDAFDAVMREWQGGRQSTLVVMATGLGKTALFSHLAEHWRSMGKRVLILAHRKELIQQAAEKFMRVSGIPAQIEMAGERADNLLIDSKVVVASVQTLKGKRLLRFPPDYFHLIIADEAHHSFSKSWRQIIDRFTSAFHVGVTATPDRTDKKKIVGTVYESCAYEMNMRDGIDQGWLAPIRQQFVHVETLDISRMKANAGGDFGDDDVAKVMDNDGEVLKVVNETLKAADGRPTLFFAASVRHAKHIADVANGICPGCCSYIASYEMLEDGRQQPMDPEYRASEIQAFRSGRRQCMASYGVFTEGFDAPNAAVIAMARPTLSRSVYAQAIGRGTRPDCKVDGIGGPEERQAAIAASSKTHMLVLDFVGNSGKHKLIHAADVLDPELDEQTREIVELKLPNCGGNLDQAIKEAKEEVKMKAERLAELRRSLTVQTLARFQEVDPFGDGMPVPTMSSPKRINPPTEGQVEAILKLSKGRWNEATIRSWKRSQAGKIIDDLKRSRDGGPPTGRQRYKLVSLGLTPPATFKEAMRMLNGALQRV